MHKRPSDVGLSLPTVLYCLRDTIDCSISCILHCMLQYGHCVSYTRSVSASCCLERKYFKNNCVILFHPFLLRSRLYLLVFDNTPRPSPADLVTVCASHDQITLLLCAQ